MSANNSCAVQKLHSHAVAVLHHLLGFAACPPGKYTAGEARCIDCPKGSYCVGGLYSLADPPVNVTCPSSMTTLGLRAASIKRCGKQSLTRSIRCLLQEHRWALPQPAGLCSSSNSSYSATVADTDVAGMELGTAH